MMSSYYCLSEKREAECVGNYCIEESGKQVSE